MNNQKKTAIMQPYFLPYIGYWQLIKAADTFVIYDNIQYTKKGWFNRNRFLQNGQDVLFSVPLKQDNDFLNVNKRFISPEFDKRKLIAQFQNAYAKAPYFKNVMPFIEEIIMFKEDNLFKYILNSVQKICQYLDIETSIIHSSHLNINNELKAEKKVLAICKELNTEIYINTIGGVELYDKTEFQSNDIELKFIKPKNIEYKQFDNDFVPWLSIVDILMFNSTEKIEKMLEAYELV